MEKSNKPYVQTNYKKNNKGKCSDLVSISKTMTLILRHKAKEFGIEIEPSGFVKIDDLLNHELLKKKRANLDIVKEVVANDQKQRFELVNRPPYYIRANQGHSIQEVKNEEILQSIENYSDYNTVVHGTFSDAWEKIKLTGLNKMGRNCIRIFFKIL
jgi:2'-phosphotransferase